VAWERWRTETNVPYSSIDEFGYSEWKNGKRKKSQCIWGRAVAEGEFVAGEMCVLLKAAMGMPAANGDESAVVALVCERV
jgi:hypothetical protein